MNNFTKKKQKNLFKVILTYLNQIRRSVCNFSSAIYEMFLSGCILRLGRSVSAYIGQRARVLGHSRSCFQNFRLRQSARVYTFASVAYSLHAVVEFVYINQSSATRHTVSVCYAHQVSSL